MVFSPDSSDGSDDDRRIVAKLPTIKQANTMGSGLFSSQDSPESGKNIPIIKGKENDGDGEGSLGIAQPAEQDPHRDPWDDDSFPDFESFEIDAVLPQNSQKTPVNPLGVNSPNVPKTIQVSGTVGRQLDLSFTSDLGGNEVEKNTPRHCTNDVGSSSESTLSNDDDVLAIRSTEKQQASSFFSDDSDDTSTPTIPLTRPAPKSSRGIPNPEQSSYFLASKSKAAPPLTPQPKPARPGLSTDITSPNDSSSCGTLSIPRASSNEERRVSHSNAKRPSLMPATLHRANQRNPPQEIAKQVAASTSSAKGQSFFWDYKGKKPSMLFNSPSGSSSGSLSIPRASPPEEEYKSGANSGWVSKSAMQDAVHRNEQGSHSQPQQQQGNTSPQWEAFVGGEYEEPSSCEEEYDFSNSRPSYATKAPVPPRASLDAFGFPMDPSEDLEPNSSSFAPSPEQPPIAREAHGIQELEEAQPSSIQVESTFRTAEIDPSHYTLEPQEYQGLPLVHTFNTLNRPPPTRRSLPVKDVFEGRESCLWNGKFDTFNHLQSEMANMLAYSDDNVVCSAPTGAGKTAIFEMALARFFADDLRSAGSRTNGKVSHRRKAVYVSPSKALCEERYDDWSRRLRAMNLDIHIVVITGDGEPSESKSDLVSAHFILTTPEKWDSLTRRWADNFYLFASVKVFLVDEVHLIADPNRGCCLEAIVLRMKVIQQLACLVETSQDEVMKSSYNMTDPESIRSPLRFVAVSATLPNISEIAHFFGAHEAHAFDGSYRPVPLTTHVIGQGTLGEKNNEFQFCRNLDRSVPNVIYKFSSGRPSIVFCHSKADTERLADALANTHNIGRRSQAGVELASRTRVSKLQRVLLHGVAYHHAGLEVGDRRVVEEAFSKGQVRVLCATSTLAMGVNLPAHLVVVKGTRAWRGKEEGYQDIDQASLLQMIGRAGRPGFDTSGTAVIMTDHDSKPRFQSLASSGLNPAKSRFTDDKLVETMNVEISQRAIRCMETAVSWMKGTLFYVQLVESRATSAQFIDSHLFNLCQSALSELTQIGAVACEGRSVHPLAASHVMSLNLVDYQAMLQISELPFDVSQRQLLKAVSQMEGLHRPVRRFEKKTLNNAHKDTKYKLEGPPSKVRVKEPWEKAFVLLQVHIAGIALEGSDFALQQEMRLMAQYASRMLSAIEAYSTRGTKNGIVAMESHRLRRSLDKRVWGGQQGTLKQVGQLENKALLFQLNNHGINSFSDVVKSTNEQIEQAAGRAAPFGRNVRKEVNQILHSALSVTASVQSAEGGTNPNCLVCKLERKNPDISPGSGDKASGISYTLLVYTNHGQGCLFYEGGITRPCEFSVMLPQTYEKVLIRLFGSIVGIDDAMEIPGTGIPDSARAESNAGKTQRIRSANNKRKARSRSSITRKGQRQYSQPTLHEVNQRSKGAQGKATVTPPQKYVSAKRTDAMVPNVPKGKLGNRPNHSSGAAAFQGNSGANPSDHAGSSDRASHRTHNHVGNFTRHQANGSSLGVQGRFGNTARPPQRPSAHHSTQASASGRNIGSKRQSSAPVPIDSQLTWKRRKAQQERLQRRAFVRKADNPFALYAHDPNDSEHFLEKLSSQNETIIQSSGGRGDGHFISTSITSQEILLRDEAERKNYGEAPQPSENSPAYTSAFVQPQPLYQNQIRQAPSQGGSFAARNGGSLQSIPICQEQTPPIYHYQHADVAGTPVPPYASDPNPMYIDPRYGRVEPNNQRQFQMRRPQPPAPSPWQSVHQVTQSPQHAEGPQFSQQPFSQGSRQTALPAQAQIETSYNQSIAPSWRNDNHHNNREQYVGANEPGGIYGMSQADVDSTFFF